MKWVTVTAVLCFVTSSFGLPLAEIQSTSKITYDSFGLPETGNHIIDIAGNGAFWNLKFGKIPYSPKNFMTKEERALFLPVMKALVNVMETNQPAPGDINTLLVESRDLMKNAPKGRMNVLGGFGLDGIVGMGLPETGDVIKIVQGEANIITQFGLFPLSETGLMTDEERREFLPVSKTFTKVLQMDNIDAATMNLLLKQSRELTNKMNASGDGSAGFLGGFGGLLGSSGGFGGLGGLTTLGGSKGLSSLGTQGQPKGLSGSKGFKLNEFVRSAVKRDSESSKNEFNKFLLPKNDDNIINVPGQGPSFNTAIGKLPLGRKNIMTPEERARFLPVMKALQKVMETDKPAASDINTLLVESRDLQNKIPKGSNIGGFPGIDTFANMGIPETGDIIKTINGEPHIITMFGAFPLSKMSLMTDEERKTFLPGVTAFIKVLEKDTLDPTEMNTLLNESRKLLNLIPENFISQFKNGLNGLG